MPILINFDKAKDITKERLRAERKPLLEALDVEMMKNWGDTNKLSEIDAKKQILRDATKLADDATSIDELKAITLPKLE
jgi:hypothetical protein